MLADTVTPFRMPAGLAAVAAAADSNVPSVKRVSSFSRMVCNACSDPGAAKAINSFETTTMPDAFMRGERAAAEAQLGHRLHAALANPLHGRPGDLVRQAGLERRGRDRHLGQHGRLAHQGQEAHSPRAWSPAGRPRLTSVVLPGRTAALVISSNALVAKGASGLVPQRSR